MTDYKLMPEEATPEMEQAAEKYWNDRKFKALSDDPRTWKGLYAAMRAAAPAVQGEPTDAELLAFAGEENFFLFCDGDDFLQIARAVMHRYMGRKTAVQGEPEIIERLASAERRCSEAISEAYKLRRLWEFAASMIAFNSKKITPRGSDEKRLIELAKGTDHGMAWSGTTDGWVTESMACSIAVTQPAEQRCYGTGDVHSIDEKI